MLVPEEDETWQINMSAAPPPQEDKHSQGLGCLVQGSVLMGVSALNKARTIWILDSSNIWGQDQRESLK